MRLKDAASFFNDTQAYDGYTLEPVFKCHFSSFDDHSADGATSRRRALNLRDEDTIPARRVVKIFDDRWVIGGGNADAFSGEVIRRAYGMKKANDFIWLRTPAQAAIGSGGTRAYAYKQYFKDVVNPLTNAEIDTFWNVFLAPDEPVARGTLLVLGGLVLRVRQDYLPVEGLRIAQSDQLDGGANEVVTFTANGTYNPVTDTYATIATAVHSLVLDFNKVYDYRTEADPQQKAGDRSMLVPKTEITPGVGAYLARPDGSKWRVLSVEAELDAWLLHIRRG